MVVVVILVLWLYNCFYCEKIHQIKTWKLSNQTSKLINSMSWLMTVSFVTNIFFALFVWQQNQQITLQPALISNYVIRLNFQWCTACILRILNYFNLFTVLVLKKFISKFIFIHFHFDEIFCSYKQNGNWEITLFFNFTFHALDLWQIS